MGACRIEVAGPRRSCNGWETAPVNHIDDSAAGTKVMPVTSAFSRFRLSASLINSMYLLTLQRWIARRSYRGK